MVAKSTQKTEKEVSGMNKVVAAREHTVALGTACVPSHTARKPCAPEEPTTGILS